MKQPNPLVPQGSFEAHARGKNQVRLAVFTILTIHVVVLGALLIHGAGCKRDDTKDASNSATNNPADVTPPFVGSNENPVTPVTPTNPTPGTGSVAATPALPTNPVVPPPPALPIAPQITQTPVAPPAGEGAAPTEYTIVKGDTFSGLAGKNGTTVKALKAANPGVDPAKLKPGQKIKIPARNTGTGAATGAGSAAATPEAAASDSSYVVKPGDNLGKIARDHGTTAKAIQRLNNLTTTQIRVGQKLKLPPRTVAASKSTPNPAQPGGAAPATVPPPLPAPAQ